MSQSHCAGANQGALRGQWLLPCQEVQRRVALAQRLPKGRGTSIVDCVAALEKGLPAQSQTVASTQTFQRTAPCSQRLFPGTAIIYAKQSRIADGGELAPVQAIWCIRFMDGKQRKLEAGRTTANRQQSWVIVAVHAALYSIT